MACRPNGSSMRLRSRRMYTSTMFGLPRSRSPRRPTDARPASTRPARRMRNSSRSNWRLSARSRCRRARPAGATVDAQVAGCARRCAPAPPRDGRVPGRGRRGPGTRTAWPGSRPRLCRGRAVRSASASRAVSIRLGVQRPSARRPAADREPPVRAASGPARSRPTFPRSPSTGHRRRLPRPPRRTPRRQAAPTLPASQRRPR